MDELRRELRTRILRLGLPPEQEANLFEELAPAAEEIYQAARDQGLGPAAALEQALGVVPAAERFGRPRGWRQDLRFGARLFRRQPGLLAAAVAALAIGIGASTAVFSVLEAVVLRPLDYHEPERLVMVWERFRSSGENVVAPANLLRWQQRTDVFEAVSPVISLTRPLRGAGEPFEAGIEAVSWDYLRMLGVRPLLGRDFTPEDDRPDTPAAVLVNHRLWLNRFGGDPGVVGRHVRLDEIDAVIAGVLPPGFRSLSEEPDLLTTARLDPARDYRGRGRYLRVVARLRPGASVERAQRDLSAVAVRLEEEDPAFNKGWGVRVTPLAEHFTRGTRDPVWLLMTAMTLVLAIVLGNIANLLLGRAAAREREFAIRSALGAAPGRLVRQVLTESFTLAAAGAVAGAGAAVVFLRLLKNQAPAEVPRLEDSGPNLPALLFLTGVTVVAALVCGAAPAWLVRRVEAAEALKEGARGLAGSHRGRLWRQSFVAGQVALSVVLLVGATSLIRSYRSTLALDPGFRPERLLTMSISLPAGLAREPRRVTQFFAELERRVRTMPEVRNAASGAWLPFAGPGAATGVWVPGRPKPAPGAFPVADVGMVTPEYFRTMGIRLRRGRWFGPGDEKGFVISESLARAVFPGADPVGQQLVVNMADHDAPMEILGVVGDIRHAGLEQAPRPMVYYPHAAFAMPAMSLVVRTEGDPAWLARSVTALVREFAPDQPVANLRTMEEWIGRSLAPARFLASVLGVFALMALALALMGLGGVLVQTVAERRHEIGVRVALGADAGEVVWLVVSEGIRLVGAGLALGLLGSGVLARWLPVPADGIAMSAMSAAVLIFGLAVIAWPAQRAAAVDPMAVLRQE